MGELKKWEFVVFLVLIVSSIVLWAMGRKYKSLEMCYIFPTVFTGVFVTYLFGCSVVSEFRPWTGFSMDVPKGATVIFRSIDGVALRKVKSVGAAIPAQANESFAVVHDLEDPTECRVWNRYGSSLCAFTKFDDGGTLAIGASETREE